MSDEESRLRGEIASDREMIARTASAIAHKADIPARARESPLAMVAALALVGLVIGLLLARRR